LGGHASGYTITLVHGNQTLNTVYVSEDRSDEFLAKMASDLGALVNDAVCFGHTHKPWHRVVNGIHFINTGSVGRPKDGDWRPCYVILSASEAQLGVEFRRVGYEVEEAVRGINAAGLPEEFGEQLRGSTQS
jgi:predicted phosphodiesterase